LYVQQKYVTTFVRENVYLPGSSFISGVKRVEKSSYVRDQHDNIYRLQQKPHLLMCHLVQRFSDPGGVVMDLTAGTHSLARACLRTGRVAVVWERDSECHDAGIANTKHYYSYLKARGLLIKPGSVIAKPSKAEKIGETWMRDLVHSKLTLECDDDEKDRIPVANVPVVRPPAGANKLVFFGLAEDVKVKQSTVGETELGVWTTKPYATGEPVCSYWGFYTFDNDTNWTDRMIELAYSDETSLCLDGSKDCPGTYANDGTWSGNKTEVFANNCEYVEYTWRPLSDPKRIMLVATRDLAKDEVFNIFFVFVFLLRILNVLNSVGGYWV
jgi:hypothetical protein